MTEDESGRDRGVLSAADREFLRNPGEYSRQATHARQTAIRKRVGNAMLDFGLLLRGLPQSELREIFGGVEEVRIEEDGTREIVPKADAVPGSIPTAVAFLARAADLGDAPIYPDAGANQPALTEFVRAVEAGVGRYLGIQKEMPADARVSIDLEGVRPVDEYLDGLDSDEPIDVPPGLNIIGLQAAGVITADEANQLREAAATRDGEQ